MNVTISSDICPPPFWKSPGVLASPILNVNDGCYTDILRLLVQLSIVGAILGLLLVSFGNFPKSSILHSVLYINILGITLVFLKKYIENKNISTLNSKNTINSNTHTNSQYESFKDYTTPTANNPFMNVMLSEYQKDPGRPPAAPVDDRDVKQTLDDYFRVQWYSDTTDVYGKNQSQRQFITQPSTTIPNDRESYQNWLYRIPGKTCKEGGTMCRPGTDGSPVVSLNQL